jgi:hypothetical protein
MPFPTIAQLAPANDLPGALFKTYLSQQLQTLLASLGDGSGRVSNRNILINGNFRVNQDARPSSSTTLAANEYWLDGWFAGSGGATVTYTDDGVDVTVNITGGSLCQRIEAMNVEGGTYCLSWSGSATGRFAGGTYGSSGLNVTGVAVGSQPVFEWTAGTLTRVQVERNTLPTPYERRMYDAELARCQRYYWRGKTPSFSSYATGNGDLIRCPLRNVVTMRTSPTFSLKTAPTYVNVSSGLALDSATADNHTLRVAANASGGCYADATGEYSLSARL